MAAIKQRLESIYDACSSIGGIRTSFPRCFSSVANNVVYSIKDGALFVSSSSSSSSSSGSGGDSDGVNIFTRADAFYTALAAYQDQRSKAGAAVQAKQLSLEEELAAERLRASTSVDISSVSSICAKPQQAMAAAAVAANSAAGNDDATGKKGEEVFWLLIKKPGIGWLLWREGSVSADSILDPFNDDAMLKQRMVEAKAAAGSQMDLQLVECTLLPSSTSAASSGSEHHQKTDGNNGMRSCFFSFTFVVASNMYYCEFTTSLLSTKSSNINSSNNNNNNNDNRVVPIAVSDKLEYGTPDFILAEEFSLHTSTWLAPANKKRLAFSACDVSRLSSANMLRPDGTIETMPFAFVDTPNVPFNLVVVKDVSAAEKNNISNMFLLPLVALMARFPWIEYVVRVLWIDADQIAVTILSRDQMHMAVVQINIDKLLPVSAAASSSSSLELATAVLRLSPSPDMMHGSMPPSSATQWQSMATPSERLAAILDQLSKKAEDNNVTNNQQQEEVDSAAVAAAEKKRLQSLSESFVVLRERTSSPFAWIDVNNETRVLSNAGECLVMMEVSQDLSDTSDGVFEVVRGVAAESTSSTDTPTLTWTPVLQRCSGDAAKTEKMRKGNLSLPRGIVGTDTKPYMSKSGNEAWLLARAFFPGCPGTRVVAINMSNSNNDNEVVHLTAPDLDVSSFFVVGEHTLVFSGIPDNGEFLDIVTCTLDLAAALAAENRGNFKLPKPVTFQQRQQQQSTTNNNNNDSNNNTTKRRSFRGVRRPHVTYFEVPVTLPAKNGKSEETTHGEPLQAALMKPDGSDLRNCPLVVYSYGGPHVSVCTPLFLCASQNLECLRRSGFAVLVCDGRFATRHSLRNARDGKYGMGTFEASDVRRCVQFAIDHERELFSSSSSSSSADGDNFSIDRSRIGFTGASYGGYLALLCLAQHGDFFKCVVSAAPVTRWSLYTSGYTERYNGLPKRKIVEQEDGKEAGEDTKSIINNYYVSPTADLAQLAPQFPDESGRLHIHHGMQDENVHFQHTQILLQALIANGKPYDLKLFPGERHGLRKDAKSAQYASIMTVRAFLENL